MEKEKRTAQAAGTERPFGYKALWPASPPHQLIWSGFPRDWLQVEIELRFIFQELIRGNLRWPLYLWGHTGTGKSVAAVCMCDRLMHCGWADLEVICNALVNHDFGLWTSVKETECYVLDEIGGRDQVTSVDADAVKHFVDFRERYAWRVGIYISNHSPDELRDLYGHRIHGRLTCGTIYEATGGDRRLK